MLPATPAASSLLVVCAVAWLAGCSCVSVVDAFVEGDRITILDSLRKSIDCELRKNKTGVVQVRCAGSERREVCARKCACSQSTL